MPNEAPTKTASRIGRPPLLTAKKIKLNITCDPEVLTEARRFAYASGISLSQFISEATATRLEGLR